MALFRFLFLGFFPIQFALAGLLVWMAMSTEQVAVERRAAYAAMLQGPPPATVEVGTLRPDDTTRIPDEVSVRAQLALDSNIRLVRTKNGVKKSEHLLYVLMDPEADAGDKVVRAGIVLLPGQIDDFVAFVTERSVDFGARGPVLEVPGLQANPSQASHAREAMAENGMTVTPDFYFIDPFLKGREAALTARLARRGSDTSLFYALAVAFALFGLFNASRWLKRGRSAGPTAADPVPSNSVPPARRSAGARALGFLGFVTLGGGYVWFKTAANPAADAQALLSQASLGSLLSGAGGVLQFVLPAVLTLAVVGLMLRMWVRGAKRLLGFGAARAQATRPATTGGSPVGPAPAAARILPDWAAVRPAAEGPAAPAPAATVPAAPRPALPKVRSGFSLAAMLPARKSRFEGPDPFDRFAERVREERMRNGLRNHPAE